MTVYVDELMDHPTSDSWPWGSACHMFADTLTELHSMARDIGCRPWWFQNKRLPHYDLTPMKRALALVAGAREATREQVREAMHRGRRAPQARPVHDYTITRLRPRAYVRSGASRYDSLEWLTRRTGFTVEQIAELRSDAPAYITRGQPSWPNRDGSGTPAPRGTKAGASRASGSGRRARRARELSRDCSGQNTLGFPAPASE